MPGADLIIVNCKQAGDAFAGALRFPRGRFLPLNNLGIIDDGALWGQRTGKIERVGDLGMEIKDCSPVDADKGRMWRGPHRLKPGPLISMRIRTWCSAARGAE